jgi:hypothetical protein
MRRTAAALALAAFGVVTFVAPVADAAAAPTVQQIHCGTVATPACDALESLQAQLAPLQPVLVLAGPVVGQASSAVQGLLAVSESPSGVSSADALDAADALQQALGLIPAPIRDLLGATALGQLTTTLDQLAAALAPVAEPILGQPAAADGAKPTVMPSAPAKPTPSNTGRESAAGFEGAPLDSGSTSTAGLPDVPDGDVLDLGPLALPDFGWTTDVPAATPLEAAPALTEDQAQVVAATAADGFGRHGASTGLVVVLFSALLGAVALGAQWWQNRRALHTIPD